MNYFKVDTKTKKKMTLVKPMKMYLMLLYLNYLFIYLFICYYWRYSCFFHSWLNNSFFDIQTFFYLHVHLTNHITQYHDSLLNMREPTFALHFVWKGFSPTKKKCRRTTYDKEGKRTHPTPPANQSKKRRAADSPLSIEPIPAPHHHGKQNHSNIRSASRTPTPAAAPHPTKKNLAQPCPPRKKQPYQKNTRIKIMSTHKKRRAKIPTTGPQNFRRPEEGSKKEFSDWLPNYFDWRAAWSVFTGRAPELYHLKVITGLLFLSVKNDKLYISTIPLANNYIVFFVYFYIFEGNFINILLKLSSLCLLADSFLFFFFFFCLSITEENDVVLLDRDLNFRTCSSKGLNASGYITNNEMTKQKRQQQLKRKEQKCSNYLNNKLGNEDPEGLKIYGECSCSSTIIDKNYLFRTFPSPFSWKKGIFDTNYFNPDTFSPHRMYESVDFGFLEMFTLIGLGLGDESDITLKGLEAVKNADIVYLEAYTSYLINSNSEELGKKYGKQVIVADREMVESGEVLNEAGEKNVALLVVGDVFGATTHSDLIVRCHEMNIETKVIHNASIMNAVGCCGLQLYRFGQTISLCFWTETWRPSSWYQRLKSNREAGLHTLVLLDIKVKEISDENLARGRRIFEPPRYMTINQGIEQILSIEKELKLNAVAEDGSTMAVGVARFLGPCKSYYRKISVNRYIPLSLLEISMNAKKIMYLFTQDVRSKLGCYSQNMVLITGVQNS
eukprot:gene9359-6581_t